MIMIFLLRQANTNELTSTSITCDKSRMYISDLSTEDKRKMQSRTCFASRYLSPFCIQVLVGFLKEQGPTIQQIQLYTNIPDKKGKKNSRKINHLWILKTDCQKIWILPTSLENVSILIKPWACSALATIKYLSYLEDDQIKPRKTRDQKRIQ